MPRGKARTEPVGLWRPGASGAERIQAARAWVARLSGEHPVPPFREDKTTSRVA